MQKPHEEKASRLTLRDLVFTSYLQEVSRGHSKLSNEPCFKKKNRGGLTTDEGPNVRMGRNIKELIEAKKKKKEPKHVRELLIGE